MEVCTHSGFHRPKLIDLKLVLITLVGQLCAGRASVSVFWHSQGAFSVYYLHIMQCIGVLT